MGEILEQSPMDTEGMTITKRVKGQEHGRYMYKSGHGI
jgi:hypothetical protein